jgi:hypothetical protein
VKIKKKVLNGVLRNQYGVKAERIEVESFDPIARAIRSSREEQPNSASEYYRTFNVVQFAKKIDDLLDLLDATADALAAVLDQRAAVAWLDGGEHIKTTIH